jgi:hypothetical protein
MPGASPNDSRLPPLLAYLVEVTKQAGESQCAQALAEFGHLAVDYVRARDVMPGLAHGSRNPAQRELRDIALRYLGLGQLEWRLEGVMIAGVAEEKRDALERALADLYVARDTAHILWGLSVGLALCDHVARRR